MYRQGYSISQFSPTADAESSYQRAVGVVTIFDSLAMSKAANADGAAARGSECAALKISAAETVGNTPPVPTESAEPAIEWGTNERLAGEIRGRGRRR